MKNIVVRGLFLVMGSLLLGVGVGLGIAGGQGVDALGTIWEGMSLTFGWSLGSANLIFNLILLVVLLFVDIKQVHVGTLLSPVIAGAATNYTLALVETPESFVMQIILSAFGVLVISTGVGVYTASELGKSAYDGITFAMSARLKVELYKVRFVNDLILLVLGYLMGGTIGLVTLVAMLYVGVVVQRVNSWSTRTIEQLSEKPAWKAD